MEGGDEEGDSRSREKMGIMKKKKEIKKTKPVIVQKRGWKFGVIQPICCLEAEDFGYRRE